MELIETVRPTDEQIKRLYQVQENLYQMISGELSDCNIRLIGGTALARCYLGHRLSYDIDISLNPADRIDPEKILAIKQIPGVSLLESNVPGNDSYLFCFFRYAQGNLNVEFSIGEDRMFRYYQPSVQTMGNIQVNTVTLETLYLNKVRAIAGDMPGLARQTLRDVFDVFVLSRESRPLADFLVDVEQKMPSFKQDRFYENLASMPWYNLLAEKIHAFGKWQAFEDIDNLANAVYAEAGMEQVDE